MCRPTPSEPRPVDTDPGPGGFWESPAGNPRAVPTIDSWHHRPTGGSMLIRKRRAGEGDIPSSEITPYDVYVNRRRFLQQGGALAAAAAVGPGLTLPREPQADEPTPYEAITSYNNYYEFGTDKADPAQNSG